jgi:hydrogenase nickel incorporation protein HypA/HybF
MSGLIRQLESIAQEQNVDKILAVKVQLGALSHFSEEHFRDHFVQAARGSRAEGAVLNVVQQTDPNDPNAQDVVLEEVEIDDIA